jgi:murein L,D-transpeptidase YcbB/YkuD
VRGGARGAALGLLLASCVAALGLLLVSCVEAPAPPAPSPAPELEASRATIAARVREAEHPWLRRPRFASFRDELEGLYAPRANAPLWLDGPRPSAAAAEAIEALAGAAEKGLDPADYDVALLDAERRALRSGAQATSERLALFDVALSVELLRLVSDLHIGRANPRSPDFVRDVEARKTELPPLVLEAVRTGRVREVVAEVEPDFHDYRRLLDALAAYRTLASDPAALPADLEPSVRPGDALPQAAELARWLAALGDLPEDAALAQGRYAGPLVAAVERFQRRHGLEPDGVIGEATARALAVPVAARVRQIELALERYRWLPEVGEQRFVFVHVPAFELRAFDAMDPPEGPALTMRVVAGRAGRTPTPVLAAALKNVAFAPYWNVPRSIVVNEMLPKIARDPGYFAAEEMEIVTDGSVLPDGPESVALLAADEARLRQRPGPNNALGRVKFLFPNAHDVYLHDTPARTLFRRSRRDFSHGCVRVEKPEELVRWVLRDQPEWTPERISEALAGATETWVLVRSRILVVLLYTTALVEEDGSIRFFEDLYGHDAALERALASGASPGLAP